jgi:hypothetical protein
MGTAYSAFYDALRKSPKKDQQTVGELSHKFLDGPRKLYSDALQSEVGQTSKSSKSPSTKASPRPAGTRALAPVEGVPAIDGSQFPKELDFPGRLAPSPLPTKKK